MKVIPVSIYFMPVLHGQDAHATFIVLQPPGLDVAPGFGFRLGCLLGAALIRRKANSWQVGVLHFFPKAQQSLPRPRFMC